MPTCDVVVVGAGIIGTACAYELSLAGLRVFIVDSNNTAAGATNLGYGSLSIQDDVAGQLALTRYGLSLWEKLIDYLPPECEYRRCGTLWIARNEKQLQIAALKRDFLKRQKVKTELLDSAQLSEAEPAVVAEVAGGLLVTGDGCLRASRAAEFLLHLASQKGVQRFQQRATRFRNHELTLADGSVIHAGSLVNAGGNEASTLTPDLPLVFVKGHVLLVETSEACALHQIAAIATEPLNEMEGSIRLEIRQNRSDTNLARANLTKTNAAAEVWIGSSMQPVADRSATLQVEPKVAATLLRKSIELIPAVGAAKPLRSWTGLRASSPDGLPFIGRLSDRQDVFVATAHGGFGSTAALASARLIVNDLLCQTSEIDPKPYRPDRFEGSKTTNANQVRSN